MYSRIQIAALLLSAVSLSTTAIIAQPLNALTPNGCMVQGNSNLVAKETQKSFSLWMQNCRAQVHKNWLEKFQGLGYSHISYEVTLDSDGNVLSLHPFKMTDSQNIDHLAGKLIQASSPFPPIPKSTTDRVFVFDFPNYPQSSYMAIMPAKSVSGAAARELKENEPLLRERESLP